MTGIRKLVLVLAALLVPVAGLLVASSASADAGTLLYSYSFASATATVPNLATASPYAPVSLTLQGNWSDSAGGVLFAGDLTSKQSVGFGKPATGDTIDIPATSAVAEGAQIKFQAPSVAGCVDTPNVGQIGRAGNDEPQIKMQESNCTPGAATFMECRFSGAANTISGDKPLVSTFTLVAGAKYDVTCAKEPDAGGTTAISITVENVVTGKTVTNTGSVSPAIGAINVLNTRYISVANKYKLPAQAMNTDNFNGTLFTDAYCSGDSAADASTCVAATFPS
jgi:hypothetical protein